MHVIKEISMKYISLFSTSCDKPCEELQTLIDFNKIYIVLLFYYLNVDKISRLEIRNYLFTVEIVITKYCL